MNSTAAVNPSSGQVQGGNGTSLGDIEQYLRMLPGNGLFSDVEGISREVPTVPSPGSVASGIFYSQQLSGNSTQNEPEPLLRRTRRQAGSRNRLGNLIQPESWWDEETAAFMRGARETNPSSSSIMEDMTSEEAERRYNLPRGSLGQRPELSAQELIDDSAAMEAQRRVMAGITQPVNVEAHWRGPRQIGIDPYSDVRQHITINTGAGGMEALQQAFGDCAANAGFTITPGAGSSNQTNNMDPNFNHNSQQIVMSALQTLSTHLPLAFSSSNPPILNIDMYTGPLEIRIGELQQQITELTQKYEEVLFRLETQVLAAEKELSLA